MTTSNVITCEPVERRSVRHALCVYPYRRELNHAGFFPPLGLEFIAAVVRQHARSLDLIDLRKECDRTRDFLRPETDLVCFSVNWNRDWEFLVEEIRSVPQGTLTIVGGIPARENMKMSMARAAPGARLDSPAKSSRSSLAFPSLPMKMRMAKAPMFMKV